MSAFQSITAISVSASNFLSTQQLAANSNFGNDGDVLSKQSGSLVWLPSARVSRYTDDTDSSQDASSSININFNSENYNGANISYGGDYFIFNESGYYSLNYSCLLSDDRSQIMISFMINGSQQYGLNTLMGTSGTNFGYNIDYTNFFNQGDELRIFCQYVNGTTPNYLLRNQFYGTPCTQLIIQKL